MQLLKKNLFPVSTDYKINKNSKSRFVNIDLRFNLKNGLIYLKRKWELKDILPKYKWINYSEPEVHLGNQKKIIRRYIKNLLKKKLLCLSYKDISLAKKLKKNLKFDVIGKKNNYYSGVETCQSLISKKRFIKEKKKYDVILCRHILEHVFNIKEFFNSLNKKSNDECIFFFEVPDCEKLLKNNDYTMLWEDHLAYFTQSTFVQILKENNMKILNYTKIKQPFEDILCAVVKKTDKKNLEKISNNEIKIKKEMAINFKKNFNLIKKKIDYFFKVNKNKNIHIYGAGHLTNSFINLFNLKKKIDFIIDDNDNKENKYFPGSDIKIISSKYLKKLGKESVCVMGINPINENKIIKKINNKEIKYYSIFSNSSRYIVK